MASRVKYGSTPPKVTPPAPLPTVVNMAMAITTTYIGTTRSTRLRMKPP